MAIQSPLFQSALELLGHSITHFNGSSELDRKLVILHLSNSVELILKDVVLDGGDSIYKNPKETITIQGCIESLKTRDVPVPYLNKLELLMDERNALQHRFGSPNELTTIFYMNVAIEFFRIILKQHYGLSFDETISQFAEARDLAAFRMREPSNDSELENLKKLARVHPLGAFLSANAYLERTLTQFATQIGVDEDTFRRPSWAAVSYRILELNGLEIPPPLRERLDDMRRLRNVAAHGRADPSKEDVVRAITTIEALETFLNTLDIETVREQTALARKKRLEERSDSRQFVNIPNLPAKSV